VWHVPSIQSFSLSCNPGCVAIEGYGAQVSLAVTEALIQKATSEVKALSAEGTCSSVLEHAAFTENGQFMVAACQGAACTLVVWHMSVEDGAPPVANCVQQQELPPGVFLTGLRFASPVTVNDKSCTMLVAFSKTSVLTFRFEHFSMDLCQGTLAEKLVQLAIMEPLGALQQHLCLPSPIIGDVVEVVDCMDTGRQVLVLATQGNAEQILMWAPLDVHIRHLQVAELPHTVSKLCAQASPEETCGEWSVFVLGPSTAINAASSCRILTLVPRVPEPAMGQACLSDPGKDTMDQEYMLSSGLASSPAAGTEEPQPATVAQERPENGTNLVTQERDLGDEYDEVTGGDDCVDGEGRADGYDAGDEDDQEAGAAPTSQKSRNMRTDDLISYALNCLKQWKKYELLEVDKVRSELPGRIDLQSMERQAQADLQSSADAESTRCMQALLEEITEFVDSAPLEEREYMNLLRRDLPASRTTKDGLERETRRWWNSVVEKVAQRTFESREGRMLHERFVGTLTHHDADTSQALSEQLRPFRELVEQRLRIDFTPHALQAAEKQLRVCLQEGGSQLETAVNHAMAQAATTWADEKMRLAAQRLRNSTKADALIKDASVSIAATVQNSVQPLAAASIASTSKSSSCTNHLQDKLLMKVRTHVKPLSHSIEQLCTDVSSVREDLLKCRSSLSAMEGACNRGAPELGAGSFEDETSSVKARDTVAKLCLKAQYQEAIEHALAWSNQAVGPCHAEGGALVEWACEQVLAKFTKVHGACTTAEAFLSSNPCPLNKEHTVLQLMDLLLQRCVMPSVALAQVDTNLEWVLCLQQVIEITPAIGHHFNEVATGMADALTELLRGSGPSELAAAPNTVKRQITQAARLAAKQLAQLQRSSLVHI